LKNDIFEYTGIFFEQKYFHDKISVLKGSHLFRLIEHPHITFSYMPEEIDENLFGEQVMVRITGYGNDGKNEGVKVELVSASKEIAAIFKKIEVPHITVSVSEDGRPVDTRGLEFEPVEPIELTGIYGGYDEQTARVISDLYYIG